MENNEFLNNILSDSSVSSDINKEQIEINKMSEKIENDFFYDKINIVLKIISYLFFLVLVMVNTPMIMVKL